jgi:nucleotide-binding universal stress UspA family protein
VRYPACALRTIVVGRAFEGAGDEVLRAGLALSRASGARLVVAHAVSSLALVPPLLGGDPELVAWSKSTLAKQLEPMLEAGDRPPELRVAAELPELLIARVAAEESADLVVIGTTATSGRLGKLLGSTAERLLHSQAFPVLVVRGAVQLPLRRVLAPIDLSLLSCDAFRCGLRILAALGGRELDVEGLLVNPPEQVEGPPAGRLEDFLACSEIPGVRFLGRVRNGAAAPEILHEASRAGCDLIMIGTRGESGPSRRLGSVTAEIVRRAPCSVLVVPPAAALGEAIAEAVQEELEPRMQSS